MALTPCAPREAPWVQARQVAHRGGANKETRVKRAVRDYLAVGRDLSTKVSQSLLGLCEQAVDTARWERLEYFHAMLDKHLDLVDRRLLKEEKIPSHEKVFSLFEPHTEWIQKGKLRPNVELGHRLLIATDQNQLIQDYDVPVGGADVDQSLPLADRLLGRYGAGSVASLSFDKGFTRTEDRELLSLYARWWSCPNAGRRTRRKPGASGRRSLSPCANNTARWRARSTAWNTTA